MVLLARSGCLEIPSRQAGHDDRSHLIEAAPSVPRGRLERELLQTLAELGLRRIRVSMEDLVHGRPVRVLRDPHVAEVAGVEREQARENHQSFPVVEGRVEERSALTEKALLAGASPGLADVGVHADPLADGAVCEEERHRALRSPAPLSAHVANAVLHVEGSFLPGRVPPALGHALAVVRMNRIEPPLFLLYCPWRLWPVKAHQDGDSSNANPSLSTVQTISAEASTRA